MKKMGCFLLVLLLLATSALAESPLRDEVLSHYTVVSEEPVTLRIGFLNDDDLFNALLDAAFLSKYPNATIEYHQYTLEQLNALLLGGIDMPDLLLCTNIVMDKMADQDMLSDFYQSGLIAAWPEEWIDISGELETDGRLYGLPLSIAQSYWLWNDELAERSGARLPDNPYDWDEFLEAAAELNDDFDGNGVRDMQLILGKISNNEYRRGMVEDFFEAYLESQLLDHRRLADGATFRTEEFRHLLDIYAKLLEIRGSETSVPSFRGEPAYLIQSLGQSDSFFFDDYEHSVMLLPVLNKEKPGYLGMASVACIPLKASHPELALVYCEGMLDPELNRYYGNLDHFFFKTMPACYVEVEYPQMTINGGDTINVTADTLHMDVWGYYETSISQKDFDMYTFCREHVLLRTLLWRKLGGEWESCLTGYLDGSLSFEQITDRLDMMLNE